jgi:Peptidase family S41
MRKLNTVVIFFGLLVCLCSIAARAQEAQARRSSAPASVAGHYEGVINTRTRGSIPVSLDLRDADKNLTGVLRTPLGDINVTGGSYDAGRLLIKMEVNGDEASFAGQLLDGKLAGEFNGFGETGTVELKRTGDAPPAPDTRVRLTLLRDAWREDLRFLAREIPKRHKNAFHFVTREQFERAVNELDAQIPKLSDDEIALGLSRIAAMVGDGHTRVNWHWAYAQVPLNLYFFGTELRVTRATAPYRRALGARVVRIGAATVDEALKRASPYVHQGENEWYVKSESAAFLSYPALLHTLGLAPDASHAEYTLEDARGKRFTLKLQTPVANETQPTWIDAIQKTPLYLLQRDAPLWHTYLPESQTVYFNFKGYPSRDAFRKFAADLFGSIDSLPVKRLVVDMRQNGGGDFTRGRDYIIPEVKKRANINRRGHLFVITGRWTFSAGMTNATDFRKETNALLVGEPTGGRPNNYGENREFILPNSHLSVWVSTQFYKFQEEDTPAVMPDQRIDPDWPGYRAGRDPVMEWILASAPKD